MRQLRLSVRSETKHQGRCSDYLRAVRKIPAAADFFAGHYVQGEWLVRDRLFQQTETALRGREGPGWRQERDTCRIDVHAGVFAGQFAHLACKRYIQQHAGRYSFDAKHLEQIIGQAPCRLMHGRRFGQRLLFQGRFLSSLDRRLHRGLDGRWLAACGLHGHWLGGLGYALL